MSGDALDTTHTPISHAAPTDERSPFGYRLRVPVDISDTDLGGVVYYGRYPLHLDRAVIAYRKHLGIPPLGPQGHLFVVRALQVEYLSSARFDDLLDVYVRTARIGRTSHTVEWVIERSHGGEAPVPIATATQVMVGVDGYDTGRPTRVPADMAERITTFEGGRLTD